MDTRQTTIAIHIPYIENNLYGTLRLGLLENEWTNYFYRNSMEDTATRMIKDYLHIMTHIMSNPGEGISNRDVAKLVIISETKFEMNLDLYKNHGMISIDDKEPKLGDLNEVKEIDSKIAFTCHNSDMRTFPIRQDLLATVHIDLYDLIAHRGCDASWLAAISKPVQEFIEELAKRYSKWMNESMAEEDDGNIDQAMKDMFNLMIGTYMHLREFTADDIRKDDVLKQMVISYTNIYRTLEDYGMDVKSYKYTYYGDMVEG